MDYKSKIIDIFTKLYNIYSIKANQFRTRSYKKVIQQLKSHPNKISNIKDLTQLDITPKMREKMEEIIKTGKLAQLEELQNKDI